MNSGVEVFIPTLHSGQVAAYGTPGRFIVMRCGRRFGKTQLLIAICTDGSVKGQAWGVFAPDYKILAETYKELYDILSPLIVAASEMKGVIRLKGGGRIDFWTLNNPRAGRSRKYHGVLIDEAAFAGPDMMDIWTKAIRPSLLDYKGCAWVFSTPAGKDDDNFFYQICTDPKHGFREFHAPTSKNPHLPQDEIEALERDNDPLVYLQEYKAEFVDWSGVAFFSVEKMLVDGQPAELPPYIDQVFAVIDTASKDGAEHDGTGVTYWGRSKYAGIPLVILDWDVVQIQASLLIEWLPGINDRIEELAEQCNAREGNSGMWIEDKDSGIALLQSAERLGLPVYPIPSHITALGKEGRAIAISRHVHQGKVKITRGAFDKVLNYRGQTKNHFLDQVCGFRMGQKKKDHRKDLLDTFTSGVAISLGDADGF